MEIFKVQNSLDPAVIGYLNQQMDTYVGDGREECLPRIDKYLYKRLITPEFQEQVFLPLLAYIGKTFIANRGGEWVMLYDEASDHWLPDIRQTDGEMKMLYHPISLILDPDEGHGICIPMKVVYQHRASNPESWD